MCCPCAIQIRPFALSYGLFFTTQGLESRSYCGCKRNNQVRSYYYVIALNPVSAMTTP